MEVEKEVNVYLENLTVITFKVSKVLDVGGKES